MKKFIATLFTLLLSTAAYAQTPANPCEGIASCVVQGQAFSIAFDHDGVGTSLYKVYVNGAEVAARPTTILVNGVGRINVSATESAAMPIGVYDIAVAASTAPTTGSLEGRSAPISLRVERLTIVAPAPPTNVRVEVQP